jgi:hypothetical protein
MGTFVGLINGTLGYEKKKEFFGNALMFREADTYNYEIYSTDFSTQDPSVIQAKIKDQFATVYSGDVNVKVFNTQNTYQFPSDSLRASKFSVSVEIKSTYSNLSSDFTELAGNYYKGLDSQFFTTYGKYLLDFKEDFTFATNANGNREFGHNVSFGLQANWPGNPSATTADGRKTYAQNIANYIFAQDKNTTFGIDTMIGQVSYVGDSGQFRNYFTESYDLMKNSYSFSRKRELLPVGSSSNKLVYNTNYSINLNTDGAVEVSEKASTMARKDYTESKAEFETFCNGAYDRCNIMFGKFYNNDKKIILQDTQYTTYGINSVSGLINSPLKIAKFYDTNSLQLNSDITFTNNPNYVAPGIIKSETLEFNIDKYNRVDASHSFDFTASRMVSNSNTIFSNLITSGISSTGPTITGYYNANFPNIKVTFPNIPLVKSSAAYPAIKTKAMAKFEYSNNPTYFVTYNDIVFKVLDYTVDKKLPADVIKEYRVVNRPTKKSLMTYGYQSEKGVISVNVKASIGKQANQFYPDNVGSFTNINDNSNSNNKELYKYLEAVYKYAGQIFLQQFGAPQVAFNWFISDSSYSFDSDGELTVKIDYFYTLKKRTAEGKLTS